MASTTRQAIFFGLKGIMNTEYRGEYNLKECRARRPTFIGARPDRSRKRPKSEIAAAAARPAKPNAKLELLGGEMLKKQR
jgi:hypothetical protein